MQPGYLPGVGIGGGPKGIDGGPGYVTIRFVVDESMRGK